MQGRQAARCGLALLLGMIGPALAAGAEPRAGESRAGVGVRIVQAAGISAAEQGADIAPDGTPSGGFVLTGAPDTAVSLSLEAMPASGKILPAGDLIHDAGPTPATGAGGTLTVRFNGTPAAGSATYRIIVHY